MMSQNFEAMTHRARQAPLCVAEIHFEDGTGRSCSRERGHDGAHYSMRPTSTGYTPIAWTGDDRIANQHHSEVEGEDSLFGPLPSDSEIDKYTEPCPDNGVSHDCTHSYIMWWPREAFLRWLVEHDRETAARRRYPQSDARG